MKIKTIALCGAPNCGKTTLFNLLTGETQRTGNWAGVTVDCAAGYVQKKFLPESTPIRLIDMPGTCSLQPYSAEEAVVLRALQNSPPDALICVVNACAPAQGLYLALQLQAIGIPLVLAVNMIDALTAQGGHMDVQKLSKHLHAPVVMISARSGKNIPALMQSMLRCAPSPALFPLDATQAIARYQWIDSVLSRCFRPGAAQQTGLSQRIDRIALHRFFAWPVLLFLLASVFYITFGAPGQMLANGFSNLLHIAIAQADTLLLQAHAPALMRSLLTEGAFRGVAAALSFLPTLLVLFLLTALLEDSGYMARAAFMLDAPLRKLGLSGRSFFPLMTGFGCTVPAILSSRMLPDKRSRTLTICLACYIPCGAKALVYLYVAGFAFPGKSGLGVLFAYLLSLFVMVLVAQALHSTHIPAPLLMELPHYHLPTLRGAWRVMREKTASFLARAFTVVFFTSLIIWFMQYFTITLSPAASPESSMLYAVSKLLLPVFKPLGFASPPLLAALFAGMMAKENILSVLLLFANGQNPFESRAAAASFLAFAALYAPCLAACAVMSKECKSRRRMLLSVLEQTAVAWLAAFVVYQIFS